MNNMLVSKIAIIVALLIGVGLVFSSASIAKPEQSEKTSVLFSSCYDTDGGYNLAVRGTCMDGVKNITDRCLSGGILSEAYCVNNTVCVVKNVTCPDGQYCLGGRCRGDIT